MKLEDFKKKNKPKRVSILFSFQSEILELHKHNYSLVSIQKFLEVNGVQATFQNLHKFIKKHQIENVIKKETQKIQVKKFLKEDKDWNSIRPNENNNPILDYLKKGERNGSK